MTNVASDVFANLVEYTALFVANTPDEYKPNSILFPPLNTIIHVSDHS